ncbi:MAG: glycoside hydrolase family 3 protein [Rhodobacterales bacterium]|nr:glycoside hydrolase family 3 protein [Rhodobacterales bacterium]
MRISDIAKRARANLASVFKNPAGTYRQLKRVVRAVLGYARGMLDYPAAWFGLSRPRDELAASVAELLIVGFYGSNTRSLSARLLARQIHRGEIGGVFFVNQNIGSIKDVKKLLRLFRAGPNQPLIAVDHEGGIVQRLNKSHGFTQLPAAKRVAARMSPDEAQKLYTIAGQELAALGFNINLGPVLDFDNPENPAIGKARRSYGVDPERITAYGEAFTRGFASAGVLCAAKHFPGHGNSVTDSHHGVADISTSWTTAELEPFARLFASPHTPAMVMIGHLRHDSLSPDEQLATVSAPIVTGLLREKLGYQGAVMTGDIDMDAVSQLMSRKHAIIQALAAGNDLVMIKNLFGYDPLLPQHVVRWVREAISQGVLTDAQIKAAAARVRAIRQRIGPGQADP